MRICKVTGCERGYTAKGYCSRHYQQFKKWGESLTAPPQPEEPEKRCSIPDCDKKSKSLGLCQRHYNKLYYHGDANHVNNRRTYGTGALDRGYIRKSVSGKKGRVPEHRLVMEQILGRPLLPNENVHHINGVKDDNRPENLELWVKFQPSGQRPEDLVKWAKEILTMYGDTC
jgi:hypothetical protein